MNPKGLWRHFYLRRRIPLPLQSAFACGQLYKVSLGTADPRDAERKLAIANGEFEQKCDQFRATLAKVSQDRSPPTRHVSWSTGSSLPGPLPGLRAAVWMLPFSSRTSTTR